jgi:transcriptional regulator with XRE-family HTH domain
VAPRASGPTIARRRLGNALRKLREDANIRIQRAARELECSPAKISRLENGLGPARKWDVRILLDLYGVQDEAERARFDKWSAATKSAGWWESDADLMDDDADRYLATETESALLRMFCTPSLPAILRTPASALAHIRARNPELTPDDAERLTRLHVARQEELLQPDSALHLEAVVDEAAIRRQVGSSEIHTAQLAWLADMLDVLAAEGRNDVTLRILPFSTGIPGQAASAFTVFSPRDSSVDPVSAFVEETWGGTWYEGDDEVAPLLDVFTELVDRSLSPTASRTLLRTW